MKALRTLERIAVFSLSCWLVACVQDPQTPAQQPASSETDKVATTPPAEAPVAEEPPPATEPPAEAEPTPGGPVIEPPPAEDLCDAVYPAPPSFGCKAWEMWYAGQCVTPGWILGADGDPAKGFVSKALLESICWNSPVGVIDQIGRSCTDVIECGEGTFVCKEDASLFGRMCTTTTCKTNADCGPDAFCRQSQMGSMCAPERCRALFDGFYHDFGLNPGSLGLPCWTEAKSGLGASCDPTVQDTCTDGTSCIGKGGAVGAHKSFCSTVCATDTDCAAGATCFHARFKMAALGSFCVPNECLRNFGGLKVQDRVPEKYRQFPYCGWPI